MPSSLYKHNDQAVNISWDYGKFAAITTNMFLNYGLKIIQGTRLQLLFDSAILSRIDRIIAIKNR